MQKYAYYTTSVSARLTVSKRIHISSKSLDGLVVASFWFMSPDLSYKIWRGTSWSGPGVKWTR